MNSSFRPRLQIIYILGRRRCNFYHNTASRENCNSLPARKSRGFRWINIHCRTNCKRRHEISMTGEFIYFSFFFQRTIWKSIVFVFKKFQALLSPPRRDNSKNSLRLQVEKISLDKFRFKRKIFVILTAEKNNLSIRGRWRIPFFLQLSDDIKDIIVQFLIRKDFAEFNECNE